MEVDLVQVNDRYFINVASAGFGAAVTIETPMELKNFLAGCAYTLMGIIKAFNFSPYEVRVVSEQYEYEGEAVVGAIGKHLLLNVYLILIAHLPTGKQRQYL